MMGFLPEVSNGRVVYADDDKGLMEVLDLLPPLRRVHAQRLMRNDGLKIRQALERVGVLVCERQAKPQKLKEEIAEKEDLPDDES